MIRAPTAAHPTETQHWPALLHPCTPHTPAPCIQHYLSGGTQFCCAPEPSMPMSLGVATPSSYPPFPPHTHSYSRATTSQSSSPPLSMSENPTASSFLAWDHVIAMKTGTNTFPPHFPIPPTSCPILPLANCSLGCTGTLPYC